MIRDTLEYLGQGLDMTEDHSYKAMNEIMAGDWTSSQIAGFLMGLKLKGETVNEISGFVRAMRDKATKIQAPDGSVDTCGTGGDGLHSFNVSTAAAIVTAAAGVPVAKHGNRSVSSKSGSADVLSALGVDINLTPERAEKCLGEIGIAFLFAPVYHASMKYAVEPRRDMGIRTVFNILGPMSNPAMVDRQIIGAFNYDVAEKMAKVLQKTGSEHVLVVHSNDGMDELALSSRTTVFELKNGEINIFETSPDLFGFDYAQINAIKGGDAQENAEIMNKVFTGVDSPMTDITAFNAGAAIYVGGASGSLKDGIETARAILKEGKAAKKLAQLIDITNANN
jgi:anthranilate phosphoribosyltransferase